MAIAQTQIQNQLNANPLQALMQGTEAITAILNNAAAAARQRVDNQRSQDAALVQNMQLAQGLAQRRAQDIDQRLIDRRNFLYRTEQDAIANDLRFSQFDASRDDQMFNRGIARERLDLSRDTAERQQQALDLRQQQLLNQQNQLNALGVVDPLVPTAENTPMPPEITPGGQISRTPGALMGRTNDVLESGLPQAASPVAQTPVDAQLNAQPANPFANFSDAQLNARVDMYKNAEAANKKAGNAAQLNQNIELRNQIEGEIARRKAEGKGTNITPAEGRAQRSEQLSIMDRLNETDLADTAAFPMPGSDAQRRLDQILTTETDRAAALAKLSQGDRDALRENENLNLKGARLQRELAAVQNYDNVEAYVAAGGTGLSDKAKERRREFYNRNRGVAATTSTQPPASGLDSLLKAAGVSFR